MPLEHVRGGVILPGGIAVGTDHGGGVLARAERTLGDLAAMDHGMTDLHRFLNDEAAGGEGILPLLFAFDAR